MAMTLRFISLIIDENRNVRTTMLIDVNPVKNNKTQQRKGTQDRSMDRFKWEISTPLFMTNKNLGIRRTPQTVVETPFDKSR